MIQSSFLDYYKLVLDKVSFEPELFHKEYRKALKVLSRKEAEQLDQWIRAKALQQKLGHAIPARVPKRMERAH